MRSVAPLILVMVAACSASVTDSDTDELLDAYSSSEAVLLDFEFDGEIATSSTWNAESTINDQLLYTIGHLNGDRSVGRLDAVELTNVKTTQAGITYHAKMPVSWGKKTQIPTSYEFILPKSDGYDAFTKKYMHECVDFGAHEVTAGSMWYYYRPNDSGCKLDAADVVRKTAKVTVSKLNTTGKYPEYNLVWNDGELDIVAVFGKYENGATSGDAGIDGYNQFSSAIAQLLRAKAKTLTTVPANVPPQPGVANPDVEFHGVMADGKKINVNVLLVDEVSSAPQSFYTRYEGLSTKADLIMYNGHAGLGQNVRALSRHGKFVAGKYLIVFMDGCDTFAYVDGSLAEARGALNPSDPTGTKFMEIVTNSMPAFFSSMPTASMALINGLMSYAQPMTYQQMFQNVDSSQVIVVTGEEDNAFKPGAPPPPPSGSWAGIDEQFSVAKSAEKKLTASQVDAGTYVFELDGTGDADLYVRVGGAPTTRTYTCRPFLSGSKERCEVSLASKGDIGVMVRGWSASSSVHLVGRKK